MTLSDAMHRECVEKVICLICVMKDTKNSKRCFGKKSALENHIESAHPKYMTLKCPSCSQAFKTKADKRMHMDLMNHN